MVECLLSLCECPYKTVWFLHVSKCDLNSVYNHFVLLQMIQYADSDVIRVIEWIDVPNPLRMSEHFIFH